MNINTLQYQEHQDYKFILTNVDIPGWHVSFNFTRILKYVKNQKLYKAYVFSNKILQC